MDEDPDDDLDEGVPLQVYALFRSAPEPDNPLLTQLLRDEFVHCEVGPDEGGGVEVRITHPALLGVSDDGTPTWGTTLIRRRPAPALSDYATGALPGAEAGLVAPDQVGGAAEALEIVEDVRSYAPATERATAFAAVVQALTAATPAVALAWQCSGMLTRPERVDELWGFVGMRREDAGADGSVVDTVGLDALDLPDVWCRYTGLDAGVVAREVGRHARGLFDASEFIADGDPVAFGEWWFTAAWTYARDPDRRVVALIPDEQHRVGSYPGEPGDLDDE